MSSRQSWPCSPYRRFERLRVDARAQAFLNGAGPAAVGAILGAAVPLAEALHETWQWLILAGAVVVLLVLRRGVVPTLLAAGAAGAIIAAAGGPLPEAIERGPLPGPPRRDLSLQFALSELCPFTSYCPKWRDIVGLPQLSRQ